MTLFSPLITIFFVIIVGIFCYKKELFNKTQIDGLELLLLKVIMPAYLFSATYKNDLSALLNTQYIAAYLSTFVIVAIIIMALFIRKLDATDVFVRVLASSYVNANIYTLPIINILLKDSTAAIIGSIVQVIIIQPMFIILLNIIKHKEQSLMKKIISVVTTPHIIMPILGIMLNYLQVTLPTAMENALAQIGSGASGLALFVFGITLGATKITTKCLKFDLLSIVFTKNLIHPLVAICIAYVMNLKSYWFNSLIISASAPTAFLIYLIAKQFSTEEELIKKAIALSAVISTISLVLITLIIGG